MAAEPRPVALHRLYGAVLLLLAVPFLAVEIPPVLDYPNHLARSFVLTIGQRDPALSQMYAPHWCILPNLATDLLLPPLLRLLPLDIAGRLVLFGALLTPLAGAAFYSRCLFGRMARWPLAGILVAFNAGLLLGFMNFLYSLGGAFAVAGIWIGWRERKPLVAVAIAAAGSVVVFFCHIMGLVLLAVLLAAYETDRLLAAPRRERGLAVSLLRRTGAALAVFAPAGLLYALSPLARAHDPGLGTANFLITKPLFILAPVMNYSLPLDIATAAAIAAVLWLGVVKGWVLLPRSTAVALGILFAAYLLAPFRVQGGAFFDFRFAIMIGYLLVAGFAGAGTAPRTVATVATIGFLLLTGARLGLLTEVWRNYGSDIAGLRAVISTVPAGARVLVTEVPPADARGYWRDKPPVRLIGGLFAGNSHLPALLLAQRSAFSPLLFADPTQQPLRLRPPFDKLAPVYAGWGLPRFALLGDKGLTDQDRARFPYLMSWPAEFDYVLVLNAGGMHERANEVSPRIDIVAENDAAALFRVPPPAAESRR